MKGEVYGVHSLATLQNFTCFVSFVKGDFRLWMFPFHFNDQKSRLENHRFYTILAPGPMLHLIFSHWLPPVRCHNTMEHLKQVSSVASSESVPKLVDHLTGPWVTGSSEWWGRFILIDPISGFLNRSAHSTSIYLYDCPLLIWAG